MEGRSQSATAETAPIGRALAQLALTLGLTVAGLWAVVNMAQPNEELLETSPRPLAVGERSKQPSTDFRSVDPMPQPALIFVVGSEQERLELAKVLELDAVVRAATHTAALDAAVTVVDGEEQTHALAAAARDTTFSDGTVTGVAVIDLR